MTQTQATASTQNPSQNGQSGGIPISDVAAPVIQSVQEPQQVVVQSPEITLSTDSSAPVIQQTAPESVSQVSVSADSPAPSQEKGFLDSMIDKGASAVASMTGQPDPFTVQGSVQPDQTPASAPVASSPVAPSSSDESQQGFFGKLRGGARKLFSTTADVAGKTLQTGANVVGGVAQTAVQTGSALGQGMGDAIQNNQDGNFLQNMTGAITDVAKTTVSAGTQAVGGVVEAGKTTVGGVVDVGRDAMGTVTSEIPDQFGGNILQGAVNTVGNLADKAVNVTGSFADQAVSVGSGALGTVENLGASAVGKVSDVVDTATGKISEVGGNVINQVTGLVQEPHEEGVQEGAIQQPVYPTGEVSVQTTVVSSQPSPSESTSSEPTSEPILSPTSESTSSELPAESIVQSAEQPLGDTLSPAA